MRIAVGLHVGFGILIGACICAIVAVIHVGWSFITIDNPNYVDDSYFFVGLFRACASIKGIESCNDIEIDSDKHDAAKGLAVTGMVCYILATISVAVFMFLYYKDRTVRHTKTPLIVSIVFANIGALLSIVGLVMYAQFNSDELPDRYYLFYCFYLLCVATLLAIIGSTVAFKGWPEGVAPNGTVLMTNGGNVSVIHTYQQQQGGPAGYPPAYAQVYPPAYAQGYPPPNAQDYPPAYGTPYQKPNPVYPPGDGSQGMPQYPPPPQNIYQPPAKQ